MVTLPQYSPGQLVCIGAPQKSTLRSLAGRIGDAAKHAAYACPRCNLSPAEKAAIEYGWGLEVSWAETNDSVSAQAHRAELLREYAAIHGRLPGFERPDNGEFVRGNWQSSKKSGAVGNPGWSAWRWMEKATTDHIPTKPGVYCVRAVPPSA